MLADLDDLLTALFVLVDDLLPVRRGAGRRPRITAAELSKLVFQAIEKEAVQASATAISDLTKDPSKLIKGLGNMTNGAADAVSKGIGGFLKKN